MFIRFTTTELDEGSHCPRGIFRAAGDLEDSMVLPTAFHGCLQDLLRWFDRNLPVPPARLIEPRAIFWFRLNAGEVVRNAWGIVGFLEAGGRPVYEVTCHHPGKVVYRDVYQVAAIPFRETRRRL